MRATQSNVILFCLLAAFLVFITIRGELPRYLAVIFTTQGGGAAQPDAAPSASQAAQDPVGAAAGALRRGLGIENGILPNLRSLFGGS